MRVALLAVCMMVACSHPKPAASPAATTDAGTAKTTSLDTIVASAQKEFHAAADDAAVDAIVERWAVVIAGDKSITDDEIRAELASRKQNLADLHSGDQRVYPDKGTMNAMMGVVSLLERALALRAAK